MKILTILGARPQFIKAAALSKEFILTKASKNKLIETIVHTGQHYDYEMSEQLFEELDIPKPSYNLEIGGGTHGENTGRMIEKVEKVIVAEAPDFVLVYGDTDSTLAGALAASKLKIPILHVESGLRSFNRKQPEEINRVITDHLSDICFAPTTQACINLKNEGISPRRIIKTDDVMADTSRIFGEKSNNYLNFLKDLNLIKNKYILATIHRPENTNDLIQLKNIINCLAFISKAKNNSLKIDLPIIMPIHPRTKSIIEKISELKILCNELKIIKPVSYLKMVCLEKNAKIIITDSGGIQKEAFLHNTPCVTVRRETEWVELIKSGWNTLANPSSSKELIGSIEKQLNFNIYQTKENFYGNGYASSTIVKKIQEFKNE
ncbi:UDP-N-acetylglucosamine 2-epimerase (non-hydrolyzing) [bacterium]|nr:UDP-N-acetylglucosamine 2-epimerase (non-hydrolyzing) [bacterium]|tara:strand:- start:6339 stop:7472 length:1134 start_codon:yes stop_codon:yes gene_type:complete